MPSARVSSDRVSFVFADAAAAEGAGRYDLVTIFEAVHDMAQPAAVLAKARALLKPGGAVLIGDERVAETFTAPGDEAERIFYAYSVITCLANGLADQPSVGTGTILRPAALEGIAREAGFAASRSCPSSTTASASTASIRSDPAPGGQWQSSVPRSRKSLPATMNSASYDPSRSVSLRTP